MTCNIKLATLNAIMLTTMNTETYSPMARSTEVVALMCTPVSEAISKTMHIYTH